MYSSPWKLDTKQASDHQTGTEHGFMSVGGNPKRLTPPVALTEMARRRDGLKKPALS